MKYLLYKFINSLGYNVSNKKKKEKKIWARLDKYNIRLHKDLLYSSAAYIFNLEKEYKDLSILENERSLIIKFGGLIFEIESTEEFLILTEIFLDKEYNFICNSPCIVIDIGANIGIASIFFSQKQYVQKIYSFEPIIDTYRIAEKNLNINNITKVEGFYNFGLGGSNRVEKFIFNKCSKGNSGIRGSLSPSYNRKKVGDEVRTVQINKASEILKPIIEENKDLRIVIKMDCEGAEYEIIENLSKENLLQKIDIIVLEWHDLGAKSIEDYLVANNFIIFSRSLGPISGLIFGKNEMLSNGFTKEPFNFKVNN